MTSSVRNIAPRRFLCGAAEITDDVSEIAFTITPTACHLKYVGGVHDERNRHRDLSGRYALLSTHFYYFGDNPLQLPETLQAIIHATQGHKSDANQPYVSDFVDWVEGFAYEPNQLYGEPQLRLMFTIGGDVRGKCARQDLEDDAEAGAQASTGV
jgi:hypothetical protein